MCNLTEIESRAKNYWVHPITHSIDMDSASEDVLSAVREARLVRAQLAAFIEGLGVGITDDTVWKKGPAFWRGVGEKIRGDIKGSDNGV